MIIIVLNSGIIRYLVICFILNIFCGILTAILGFFGFILLFLSLFIMYIILYLFRYDEHVVITSENLYVSPTDGKIVKIENQVSQLPDIILNNEQLIKNQVYSLIEIESNITNIFFKTSPCDGVITKIQIIEPRTISINSNFKHLSYRKYITIEIKNIKDEIVILIFEIPYVDKNYNVYKLYVNEGDVVKQDKILICIHFYSYIYCYLPLENIKNTVNQSLFYGETGIN